MDFGIQAALQTKCPPKKADASHVASRDDKTDHAVLLRFVLPLIAWSVLKFITFKPTTLSSFGSFSLESRGRFYFLSQYPEFRLNEYVRFTV